MLSTSKCRLANPTSTGSVMVSLYHPYQVLVSQEMICQGVVQRSLTQRILGWREALTDSTEDNPLEFFEGS